MHLELLAGDILQHAIVHYGDVPTLHSARGVGGEFCDLCSIEGAIYIQVGGEVYLVIFQGVVYSLCGNIIG